MDELGEKSNHVETDFATSGSDRTRIDIQSKFRILYNRAARTAGVDPQMVFDVMNSIDFRRIIAVGVDSSSTEHHLGANGIIIYDAKTEKGIKGIFGPEFTFKDLDKRNEAILTIVALID